MASMSAFEGILGPGRGRFPNVSFLSIWTARGGRTKRLWTSKEA
jgi:hypothetical protein